MSFTCTIYTGRVYYHKHIFTRVMFQPIELRIDTVRDITVDIIIIIITDVDDRSIQTSILTTTTVDDILTL